MESKAKVRKVVSTTVRPQSVGVTYKIPVNFSVMAWGKKLDITVHSIVEGANNEQLVAFTVNTVPKENKLVTLKYFVSAYLKHKL